MNRISSSPWIRPSIRFPRASTSSSRRTWRWGGRSQARSCVGRELLAGPGSAGVDHRAGVVRSAFTARTSSRRRDHRRTVGPGAARRRAVRVQLALVQRRDVQPRVEPSEGSTGGGHEPSRAVTRRELRVDRRAGEQSGRELADEAPVRPGRAAGPPTGRLGGGSGIAVAGTTASGVPARCVASGDPACITARGSR